MSSRKWHVGDWAVYEKQKTSSSPGPRAQDVTPATSGETYSYIVEKYWVVVQLQPENMLRLRTRRGKEHIVSAHDPRLRKARWWEKCFFASRFPAADENKPGNKTD